MPTTERPLLIDELAALQSLSLGPEDLEWLVATGQLNPITIRCKRLFPVQELEALIRAYQSTQYSN